jgi:hypothetical protein
LPNFEIIVGGDLNSFLKPLKKVTAKYCMYPVNEWEFTTLKKKTYSQAQYHEAEIEIKESKDRIISTLKIEYGEVSYLSGEKASDKSYLPSHDHPFDHLLCVARISK